MRAFRDILKTHPTDRRAPSALYELSQLYRVRHESTEAIRCAQRILTEYPDSYETRIGLASYRVATYMVHDTGQYKESIEVSKAALENKDWDVPQSLRRSLIVGVAHAYNELGDGAAADEWLSSQLASCPNLLVYGYYYRHAVEAKLKKRDFDGALSVAKAAYATCDFNEKAIKESTELVRRAFMAEGEVRKGLEFLAAQENAAAPNPLAEVPFPELTDEQVDQLLKEAGQYRNFRHAIRLYAGQPEQALADAREFLTAASEGTAAEAIMEIARCLKAVDLNLVRANQFLAYAKTGEGENPLAKGEGEQ